MHSLLLIFGGKCELSNEFLSPNVDSQIANKLIQMNSNPQIENLIFKANSNEYNLIVCTWDAEIIKMWTCMPFFWFIAFFLDDTSTP